MDLHFTNATATTAERESVDALLGKPDTARHGVEYEAHSGYAEGGQMQRERRHLLLPVLHAVQSRIGWISPGALNYLCERLTVPPAEAYGVATFYALFSTEPQPPTVLHVCDDIACKTRGADTLCAALETKFGPEGKPDAANRACWKRSPCLGLCEKAPAALVQAAETEWRDVSLAPSDTPQLLAVLRGEPYIGRVPGGSTPQQPNPLAPFPDSPRSSAGKGENSASYNTKDSPFPVSAANEVGKGAGGLGPLLARVGKSDPESLDDYRANGGYVALRRALEIGPQAVIREVTDAKLTGRGGAAFPTGVKWKAVAEAPARPHYIVCNADESEPGTFKDRVLMEEDPFAVIEAMTIAGYVCGAEQGFIYIRGEYPEATRRLQNAIDQARARGFLGEQIMSRNIIFDIEIRRGAGAYICGEETALLNSIEGKRGEPRNKPPFPVYVGLFGKPTAMRATVA